MLYKSYDYLAEVYDELMDNVPYDIWSDFIIHILKENQIENGLIADLGCGTGAMTEILAEHGYDMIGIDNASSMLEIATDKKFEKDLDILYLLQDIREFELYGSVQAIISICDTLNYILEKEELKRVFQLVEKYLDPGGLFFFDFNTVYKYETVIGDRVIAENREDISFIWENTYDKEEGINCYELTLFVKEEEMLYNKYEEIHYQRGYTLEEIKELIEDAGLEFTEAFEDYQRNPVKKKSERICVIARKAAKKEEIK